MKTIIEPTAEELDFSFSKYAIVNMDDSDIRSILTENLGDESISQFDLRQVQIEGKTWTIPGVDKNTETKELKGIIAFKKITRSYWSKGLEESSESTRPNCYSDDGEFGIGNPGGECYKCPLAQWGSDKNGGKGQECSKKMVLFVFQEEDILPIVVSVPPSSLKNFKAYFIGLTSKNLPYFGVKTKLTLEEAKNGNGIKYSVIVPALDEILSKELTHKVKQYADSFKNALKRSTAFPESAQE